MKRSALMMAEDLSVETMTEPMSPRRDLSSDDSLSSEGGSIQRFNIFKVPPEHVTSSGLIGTCHACKCHPQATVEIYGARFCANCSWSKFPKECEGNLRFENTDATFECPADSCEAKELSFMEYFVGSCCDDGLVTNENPRDLFTMHNLHYISSDLKRQAENNLEVATNRAGEAKRKLEKAKKAFKEAEAERKAADVCLFGLNKVHKKVQKRLLSVTKDTVADSLDEEPPAKQSKNDEENEKLHCKVCFYPFDDEHHEAVLTTCGHKACFNCLTTLRKNECPSCRKKFTKGKILKIFD